MINKILIGFLIGGIVGILIHSLVIKEACNKELELKRELGRCQGREEVLRQGCIKVIKEK